MKKFKSKRRIKRSILKLIIVIIVVIFILKILLSYILNTSFYDTSEQYLNTMFESSNIYLTKNSNNYLKNLFKVLTNSDIKEPSTFISSSSYDKESSLQFVNKEIKNKYLIYLYNTHQSENYKDITIMDASNILKDYLLKYNIDTLVEERSVIDLLNINGWDYTKSYDASRLYLEDTIKENKFDLIIDIHRDAVKYADSTTNINGIKYAKIMFVIGTDYDNSINLQIASNINNLIDNLYPTLSRGILKQGGYGYNGRYNQDVSNNILLLEIGGTENDKSEIENTMNALSNVLNIYLGETHEQN